MGSIKHLLFKKQFAKANSNQELVDLYNGLDLNFERLSISDKDLEELVEESREFLGEFISSNGEKIRFGIDEIFGTNFDYRINDFVKLILLTSSIYGSKYTVELIEQWTKGKPLCYWLKAKIINVKVSERICIDDCIEIVPATEKSLDEAILSKVSIKFKSVTENFGNLPVLAIKRFSTPAFSKPDSGVVSLVKNWSANKELNDFVINPVCRTLSLMKNKNIQPLVTWSETENWLPMIEDVDHPVYQDRSQKTKSELTESDLFEAKELFLAGINHKDSSLRVSIDRWLESIRATPSFKDKCISLRIALEALFLDDSSGESSFRLASYCSHYLGKNFEEREKIFNTIRKFYILASKYVHGSQKMATDVEVELFSESLELCRLGIMKRVLESNEKPNYTGIMLGNIE